MSTDQGDKLKKDAEEGEDLKASGGLRKGKVSKKKTSINIHIMPGVRDIRGYFTKSKDQPELTGVGILISDTIGDKQQGQLNLIHNPVGDQLVGDGLNRSDDAWRDGGQNQSVTISTSNDLVELQNRVNRDFKIGFYKIFL